MQPLVGFEQLGEGPAAVEGKVFAVGEQGVALSLDEGTVLGGEAAVLAAADGVERVTEVAHNVECVEDDSCLWRLARERGAKGLPPVHRGELDARRLSRAQCGKEEVHVGLGAALADDPDRPPAVEAADDDAVVVPLPDGNLVHADRLRRGQAGAGNLLLQVDPVENLDRAVVEALRLSHCRVGHLAAERAHMHREALREALGSSPTSRGALHTGRGTAVHTVSSVQCFSAPQHQHPGIAVTEDADEPGGCHEARQREEGAN